MTTSRTGRSKTKKTDFSRYEIIQNLKEEDASEIYRLYQQTWWANDRSVDLTRRVIKGSTFTWGILHHVDSEEGRNNNDNNQGDVGGREGSKKRNIVGFARVISDRAVRSTLYDLIVDENHQGKGLGSKLLEAILSSNIDGDDNDVDNVNSSVSSTFGSMELYCKEEMIPYYEKFGFGELLDDRSQNIRLLGWKKKKK